MLAAESDRQTDVQPARRHFRLVSCTQRGTQCTLSSSFVSRFYHVHVRYMLSPVRLSSVCLSSVTFVRPTQAVQIFGNISTALGTLATRGHPLKILRRSSQGNPSAGGVKDKRGSQI